MHYLNPNELFFPPPESAHKGGILAVGGDLSPARLVLAYESGIFPWFDDNEPILWWSPEKRMVLFPDEVVVSKSMRNIIDKKVFHLTFNENFENVIAHCKAIKRVGQKGTWITNDMVAAYVKLHGMGIAKSVEVWQGKELVGGLYGIDLGHVFCGESMFSKVSNASKVAFIALAQQLKAKNYRLLDCQVYNEHLESLGAREIPRKDFLMALKR